jgi:hypothetical protein
VAVEITREGAAGAAVAGGEAVANGESKAKPAPAPPDVRRNRRGRLCVICWSRLTKGQRTLCSDLCRRVRKTRLQRYYRDHPRGKGVAPVLSIPDSGIA